MKKLILALLLLAMVLSACSPAEMAGVSAITTTEEVIVIADSETLAFLNACISEISYTKQSEDWRLTNCLSVYDISLAEFSVGDLSPVIGQVYTLPLSTIPFAEPLLLPSGVAVSGLLLGTGYVTGLGVAYATTQTSSYEERMEDLTPALPEQRVVVLYPVASVASLNALLAQTVGQEVVTVAKTPITITWTSVGGCNIGGFFDFNWWDDASQGFKSALIEEKVEDSEHGCSLIHFATLFVRLAQKLNKFAKGLDSLAYFKFADLLIWEIEVLAVKILVASGG